MKAVWLRSFVTISGLVLCLLLAGQVSAGGSKKGPSTSGNAPPAGPKEIVPGHYRLTCELLVSQYRGFFGEYDPGKLGSYSRHSSQETTLEFEKYEGDRWFTCISGCKDTKWKQYKRDGNEPLPILPANNSRQYGMPYLPAIDFAGTVEQPAITVRMSAAMRTHSGRLATTSNSSHVLLREGREIIAKIDLDELIGESREKLHEMYQASKTEIVDGIHASQTLRCRMLTPGQLSKTEIENIYSKPPRPGTISIEEFDKLNNLRLDSTYSDLVVAARKVDPDHRRARISERKSMWGSVAFLEARVPLLRQSLDENPQLSGNQGWAILVNALGIPGMSPTGIVAGALMPLIIAESEVRR